MSCWVMGAPWMDPAGKGSMNYSLLVCLFGFVRHGVTREDARLGKEADTLENSRRWGREL
jgi:hypothetical protein